MEEQKEKEMENQEVKQIDRIFFSCHKCDQNIMEILWLQEGELFLKCRLCGNFQMHPCTMIFKEGDLVLEEVEEE